jgi:signal transduction histidine kinase
MSAAYAALSEVTARIEPELFDSAQDAVLQDLAHALRQPLGAIEAIAYFLNMTLPPGQPETSVHLIRLQELVAESNAILCEALRQSRVGQVSYLRAE